MGEHLSSILLCSPHPRALHWLGVGGAMGSVCSKKELTTKGTNKERSSSQPVISCPLAAFPPLPPTPRPPRAFLSKQQKAGSPLGWGSYQRGSGAGFSPILLSLLCIPTLSPRALPPSRPCRSPWGSRVGEGKKFKSVELVVVEETEGTPGRDFSGPQPAAQSSTLRLGWSWWLSLFCRAV